MTTLNRTRLAGGAGGNIFGAYLLPDGARLTAIHVHAGECIDGLQLEYLNRKRTSGLLPIIGGVGGARCEFRVPKRERIVAISGRYDKVVNGLQFHTNRGSSRLFGTERGKWFVLKVAGDSEFRGIYGRAGWYLDALGLVMEKQSVTATSLAVAQAQRIRESLAAAGKRLVPGIGGANLENAAA